MYCINTVQGRQKQQGIDSDRAIGQWEEYFLKTKLSVLKS